MLEEHIKRKTAELFIDWQGAFERLFAYKKPFVVNSDVVQHLDYHDIYLAPIFAKSGRQMFAI